MNESCVPGGVSGFVVEERVSHGYASFFGAYKPEYMVPPGDGSGDGRERPSAKRMRPSGWESDGARRRRVREERAAEAAREEAERRDAIRRERERLAGGITDVFEDTRWYGKKVRTMRVDGHAGRAARVVLLAVARVTGVGVASLRLAGTRRTLDERFARLLAAHALWSMAKLPVKEIAVVMQIDHTNARSMLRRAEALAAELSTAIVPMADGPHETMEYAVGCVAEAAVVIEDELPAFIADARDESIEPSAVELRRAEAEARRLAAMAEVSRVLDAVAALTGVSAGRITAGMGDRCRDACAARAVAAAAIRARTELSLPQTARSLGLRSHGGLVDALARLDAGRVRVPLRRGGDLDGLNAVRVVIGNLTDSEGSDAA